MLPNTASMLYVSSPLYLNSINLKFKIENKYPTIIPREILESMNKKITPKITAISKSKRNSFLFTTGIIA